MLSVIIPTLNEAQALPALLSDLAQQSLNHQVLIADGGSSDGTLELAQQYSHQCTNSIAGRGQQMNTAAAVAHHDWLLFLHADSRLPDPLLLQNALAAIEAEQDSRCCGHFGLQFIRSDTQPSFAYRYMEGKTRFNRTNTTNGDQGLLIHKDFFTELGGFDESLPFLEDQRLAEHIRQQGRWITLPGKLQTSARRFETEGWANRYFLMAIIMACHNIGLQAFFDRAGSVYANQANTQKLQLSPFLQLIVNIISTLPWREQLKIWYAGGRYVRQNSWQLAYRLDLKRSRQYLPTHYPVLGFHDRYLQPLLNWWLPNTISAILTCLLFRWLLPLYFSRKERPHN